MVEIDTFRNGMAMLASAVNVVTTGGPEGRAGFTATADKGPSFSLDLPLGIGKVCLVAGVAYALLLAGWDLLPKQPLRDAAGVARRPGAGLAAGGLLLALLAFVPLFASGSWTSNLVEALVFATIALGLNISMGMAGLLVLGWSVLLHRRTVRR